jgi:hypothetical protein
VCTLRDIIIADKMWTYCHNFTHGAKEDTEIRGPIFANGKYEGYVRIPWLGKKRPKMGRPVKCFECGDYVEDGIEIELIQDEKIGFCCNKNYLQWWSTQDGADPSIAVNLDEYEDCPKKSGTCDRLAGFVDKGST